MLPGMVKIGSSRCVARRAQDLSMSQPFDIIICYSYQGWGALEIDLHRKFASLRVESGTGREWFWMEPAHADTLIRAAILEREML